MTICFDKVTVTRESHTILQDISVCFREGECTLLAGCNGAGKTMLASHLMGLYPSYSGKITLNGKPLHSQLHRLRRTSSMVFQEAEKLLIGQTVEAELRFTPENLGFKDIDARVTTMAQRFELEDLRSKSPSELSGGERRRLAIAAALIADPLFLIFDEPFTSLDYPSTQSFLRLLLTLKEEGKGVLIITHEYHRMLAHAERLIVMHKGRIVFDGDPQEGSSKFPLYGLQPASCAVSSMSWLHS